RAGLLQRAERSNHRVKQGEQHQQTVLVVVQLAVAGPGTAAADAVQPVEHRQQSIEVLEADQIAPGRLRFRRHGLTPAPGMTTSQGRTGGANSVPNRRGTAPIISSVTPWSSPSKCE